MPPPSTGLPVESAMPALARALAEGNAALLVAPPGAGKTTLVPLHLLDAPWRAGRRILLLEPRRLAARAAAARMAELLGEPVGRTVGYAMRFERRVGPDTRIEVVTEGLLTRYLQRDPALESYAAVLFDEFHERSLDADLGLALCLEVQETLRPDLRLLVMSATLDDAGLAAHLDGAPVIRSEGRQFPVHVEHLGADASRPLELHVASAVELALGAAAGGVLVFLPGGREIRAVAELLSARLPGTPVLPLYGDLPRAAQEAAIRPPAARRVVLATNIAETSLTIEGIGAVVDSGLERRPLFSARTGMSRLVTAPIARASADQRAGRAGRLGPGACLRLWSVEDERGRAPHRPAEIEAADLAPLALELAAWGVADPRRLRFPTQPPAGPFAAARRLLGELAALDADGVITPHGRAMAELPLHPRLAHMLLAARGHGLGATALATAALLGTRDTDEGTDFALRLARPMSGDERRIAPQLARLAGMPPGAPDPTAAGATLSLAFPDRIAQARAGGRGSFLLANGRGARLDRAGSLASERWLAVAELDDTGAEARIRLAAPLSQADLETLHAARIVESDEIELDSRSETVLARQVRRIGAIHLSERPFTPNSGQVAAVLCEAVRERGLERLPWADAARQLRGRVELLRRIEPDGWPDFSAAGLAAGLEGWLGPHLLGLRRLAEVDRLDLAAILRARLGRDRERNLARRAPERLAVPSGRMHSIDYMVDPPVLAVKLQELFGLTASPAIDGGRVRLVLHLLSPAQRPLAVTSDLAGFWATGYPAVRKELRGRYPKHPWPEDPMVAAPTHRTKRAG
ncbi:MAG: ATP-dependent helicase HrpB [Geminicoccaceae bacterium]